jgi:hypothetical protein
MPRDLPRAGMLRRNNYPMKACASCCDAAKAAWPGAHEQRVELHHAKGRHLAALFL